MIIYFVIASCLVIQCCNATLPLSPEAPIASLAGAQGSVLMAAVEEAMLKGGDGTDIIIALEARNKALLQKPG
jgi:hypothetical protein